MRKTLLFIPLLLLVLPARAWDFCWPNEDGIMLYYNVVSQDEQCCELALCQGIEYNCDTLRIPEVAISRGNQERGDPDTTYAVIGIGTRALSYAEMNKQGVYPYTGPSTFRVVQLPYGLSYISNTAFNGSGVEEIVWPENNEWFRSIGNRAFTKSALQHIVIPKTTEAIGEYAFSDCLLNSVEFEEGNKKLTLIPDNCFYSCYWLTETRLSPSITERGKSAFEGCWRMKTVRLSPNLKTIGSFAFSRCSGLEAPRLPYGLQFIKSYAFQGHPKWKSLELPATMCDIHEYAFSCGTIPGMAYDRMGIDTLYVNCETPPYCVSEFVFGAYTYDDEERNYTSSIKKTWLVVPVGSVEEYATTWPWTRFDISHIIGRDVSGIKGTKVREDGAESIFSVDGRQMPEPRQGLNIIRYKDGTAKKVVVK